MFTIRTNRGPEDARSQARAKSKNARIKCVFYTTGQPGWSDYVYVTSARDCL